MLDLITIGRSSVDLYSQQINTRLEHARSFKKSVGGCPSNIAIGTSRLGLKTGIITSVGAEQMGQFILEAFQKEGVDTKGVKIDADRLSALAILSVQDQDRFPLVFYRENCADMAIDETDIDPAFIASARAVLVTGTHFSQSNTWAAQFKAMRIAREIGRQIILDIDFRPNLWGLSGHADGENRFVASDEVSTKFKEILPLCDVIVGTEEEICIAGGSDDVKRALQEVRELSSALIVLKRGAEGCIVYEGNIPDNLEDGIVGAGFKVDLCNVLGAGDAFMSGFLRGYLRDEPLETCCSLGNASGALVVSRLMCSSEIPTYRELLAFIEGQRAPDLDHLHWSTTRRPTPGELMVFAIDHRTQLEEIAAQAGRSADDIMTFKFLALKAAMNVANGRPGYGMFLDDTYALDTLQKAEEAGLWVARPVELPGSRPLNFEGIPSLGAQLQTWPSGHVVKVLCFMHPDDVEQLTKAQINTLRRAQSAARANDLDLLIEVISSKHGEVSETTVSSVIKELYCANLRPDWWKLEAQPSKLAWQNIASVVEQHDPDCRGILMLGLDAPIEEVKGAMTLAKQCDRVRGFAVGRTIFSQVAKDWFSGSVDDAAAVQEMANRFAEICNHWESM